MQRIDIHLAEEVADFDFEKDTLYLDHPTINTLAFYDQSFDAQSWQWDFGNGARSSLQNPTINFNQAGTYVVSLSVETLQGCQDIISKYGNCGAFRVFDGHTFAQASFLIL